MVAIWERRDTRSSSVLERRGPGAPSFLYLSVLVCKVFIFNIY
ncbi:hypothetical protein FOPG_18082 [Fusarium oxysporum f. sp. conglutinans race 2 54008]|uniref:Uncharacterized protein n=1 Tax=Fusarium oxysporum f. sp. conglutinans race 2 54008 TaxID=1089457 RepID=X0GQV0_FUSOX|nr:hypothetical protein FOPG_18082 [Fusarium oxysporum f. sp. conglutinans race 2 54008]